MGLRLRQRQDGRRALADRRDVRRDAAPGQLVRHPGVRPGHGHPREHGEPGVRRGLARRRLGADRARQGVLPDRGSEQLQHLHRLVGLDRPCRPEHVPELGAERRAVGRRTGRRGVPDDGSHRDLGGHRRPHHDDLLQRLTVCVHHLRQHRPGGTVAGGPRFGGREHALHHRRHDAHTVQPCLYQRHFPPDVDHNGAIPLLGQRRER